MAKRGRGSENKPLGQNLVSTWREISTNKGQLELKEALGIMNLDLGTNYLHHRITEWEQGKRQPSIKVINYMIAKCIPILLENSTLKEEEMYSIIDRLTIASIDIRPGF